VRYFRNVRSRGQGKNRDRLLAGDIASEFLAQILDQPRVCRLLSSEHFSVDGSLVEAWGSMKSFRPKDDPGAPPTGGRNGSRDFHGERRANDRHASTTDPDARLHRKGPGHEAKLCFVGHVLMENRHGLVVDATLTRASGNAERLAALALLDRLPTVADDARCRPRLRRQRLRAGAARAPCDPAYRPEHQRPSVSDRSPDHPSPRYGASQRSRKRIEEAFAWIKTVAGQSRTKLRGLARVRSPRFCARPGPRDSTAQARLRPAQPETGPTSLGIPIPPQPMSENQWRHLRGSTFDRNLAACLVSPKHGIGSGWELWSGGGSELVRSQHWATYHRTKVGRA
jgi:hypothetical protein